jgi:hypothetical protein
MASAPIPASEQIREEHVYVVGAQAVLRATPLTEYVHSMADPRVMPFHGIGLSGDRGSEWEKLDAPTMRGLIRSATTAAQIIEETNANAAEIKVLNWLLAPEGSINLTMRLYGFGSLTQPGLKGDES